MLTILCTVFLIASEIVTELGVAVSPQCNPVKMTGLVIEKGDISGRITVVEKGASAFFVQNLTFYEGPLTRVPAGLPRRLMGNECISCMDSDPETYPDIISNCTVVVTRRYEPGEIEIGVTSMGSPFGNITHGFREVNGGSNFIGQGDVTNNGEFFSAFVVDATKLKEITYIEYSNQRHLSQLVERAREHAENNLKGPVWESIRSPVEKMSINCGVNLLSTKNFEAALQIYRTIQLENPVNPAGFNETAERFASLNEQDVYRAALSIKVIDDHHGVGEYFAYTTCGVYNWMFFLPMGVCVFFILLLGIVSLICTSEDVLKRIPYNSRTWFRHAQMEGGEAGIEDCEPHGFQKYTAGMSDEMIILEFGEEAELVRPRIALRSRCYGQGGGKKLLGAFTPPSFA